MTPDSTPHFQLPQRPAPKAGGSAAAVVACVLLVAVLALQVYGFLRPRPAQPATGGAGTAPAEHVPPEALKDTALRLEDKNLPVAAADAWQRYLDSVTLPAVERANILYRIAKLQYAGEQYQFAIAHLYLAERLAGDQNKDLSRQIALQVRECLQKLGRYSELTREMAERATPTSKPSETGGLAGQQVVAEIGEEKITVADFDRLLQGEIESSISAQAELAPEEADEMRKQALKQFADPQAKAQALQQIIANRVLAAEARRTQLDQAPEYRERLVTVADHLLAMKLMTTEVAKRATVTPEDTRRFYEAEKERYAEPAKLTFAHILVGSETEARDLLARIQAGADFGELAQQHSTDERTKKNGGRVAQPMLKDAEEIPGIGRQAEFASALWAVGAGTVLNDVYHTQAGWHVAKVLERTERVEKSYEDVKDRVERDARTARQREVTQQYLQELFGKQQVKLYPEAFKGGKAATTQP